MQFVRMLFWVLILAALLILVIINWGEPVAVRFWPGAGGDNFLFEWPVGFIALVFLVIGAAPPYLLYRGMKWRLNRRISHLESAARTTATTRPLDTAPAPAPAAPPPVPPDEINRPLP